MRKQLGGRLIVAGVFVFCMARAENKTDISLFFASSAESVGMIQLNRHLCQC
jgi:hypothetical protein